MEPKTGKRIVSKGEYARVQAARASMNLFSMALILLVIPSVLIAILSGVVFCVAFIFVFSGSAEALGLCLGSLFVCLLGYAVVCGGTRLSKAMIDKSFEIDPGVPFTRANTAGLPAPDSLVRASSEPVQEQQAVLLRAATEGQETPSEQLVRASAGKE